MTFDIIATTANELLQPLHARTPVPPAPENWPLGSAKPRQTQRKTLLKSYPSAGMAFCWVDRHVDNVGNDNPDYSPRLTDELSAGGVITCRQLVYWKDRAGY
jgi:putative SOS response-associated peptidase YedK